MLPIPGTQEESQVKTLAYAIAISFIATTAMAQTNQGLRLSAVTVGSGESPIVSGLAVTVQAESPNGTFVDITAQEVQAWVMAGKNKKLGRLRASFYGSVGHMDGAPWVGPYASLTLPIGMIGKHEVSVTTMAWPGFFIGREPASWQNDGVKNPESLLVGWFEMGTLGIGPLALNVSHLNFLDDKTNWLFGAGYTRKVTGDIEVSASANWNQNAERAMYYIGFSWRPRR